MSLAKPKIDVDYTDTFSAWDSLNDYFLDAEVVVEDLSLGPWSFILTLDNKNGQLKDVFSSMGSEYGFYLGFRFKVNNKILGFYRASTFINIFDPEGSMLKVVGYGLGYEAFRRKAYPSLYPRSKADWIIYHQILTLGDITDCSYSIEEYTAPRSSMFIINSAKPSLRDVIIVLEEDVGYSASFDSRTYPAPLEFHALDDSTKRLNIVLKNVLMSQSNNVFAGSEPRTIDTVKNHLTLEQYKKANVYFSTRLPNIEDGFTEAIWSVFGYHWILDVGDTIEADATDPYEGDYCIKAVASGTDLTKFHLLPGSSMYGTSINYVNEDVNRITWFWKNSVITDSSLAFYIRLLDDDSHTISHTFAGATTWTQCTVLLGDWVADGWTGDTGTFNGNILQIILEVYQNPAVSETKTLRLDRLYFYKNAGYDELYLEDAASMAKGVREEELSLPAGYPFVQMKLWGDEQLVKLSNPNRMLNLAAKLDPALILEDDEVTPASILPGWLVQANVPRWNVNTVANGGVWWRIMNAAIRLPSLEHEFLLMPTASETVDYSALNANRLQSMVDPSMSGVAGLKGSDRNVRRLLSGLQW